MSTTATTRRFGLVLASATLFAALVGGIASASAQSDGGNGGSGAGDGGSGTGNPVLVFGTAGNCPPTIACGPGRTERPPLVVHKKRADPCDDYRPGSRLYRQCRYDR